MIKPELGTICTQIADTVVPKFRDGKKSYFCTGNVAKRWQAAWDGACIALGYDSKDKDRHASEAASRIDDLLAEFDTKPFTLADYQRERAELERRFLASHGTHAEDIDIAIRRGILLCNDPLVEEWVALQALAPYVSAENE